MSPHHVTLRTHNLTVGYQPGKESLPVIKNINVEAKKGQLICFMGPNGAGKSTLLRTICGLQPPLKGTISIGEKEVRQLKPADMARKIGLVLTDRINAANMNAYELVALGRYPYLSWNLKTTEKDQKAIDQAIEHAGISGLLGNKIYELSDGQLQKVMIARALAQDTPILILDEPTAHLDLNNRVAVVQLLQRLAHDANKTIIMATHELDLAFQVADRLWLAGGKEPIIEGIPEDLVLSGAIDDVFQFKGYDLKTGQLEKRSRGFKVALQGAGHTYLWTKNALERSGFDLDNKAENRVIIKTNEGRTSWMNQKEGTEYNSLEGLIESLVSVNMEQTS